jgi:hypothetical protein
VRQATHCLLGQSLLSKNRRIWAVEPTEAFESDRITLILSKAVCTDPAAFAPRLSP